MSNTTRNDSRSSATAVDGRGPTSFEPYIPAEVTLPEMTPVPLIVGTILGMIFGASSLYLVLKVGLTVSASIPVAVIAITLFKLAARFGFRESTILENNIVQSAGSAGESIAFGVGVTMPSILILGFDLELSRVMLVAILGGLLGVLMMIPLRRALIVAQHGVLKYPEGTACAEVLKAGASAESKAKSSMASRREASVLGKISDGIETNPATIFIGLGIGLVYKALMRLFMLWKEIPEKIFGAPFKGASISAEISPELLGVGYIIGPRIASIMCAGGVLSYLVLIPAIKFFGDQVTGIVPPGSRPISEMGPHDVRGAYVLYIGAGAVAAGGIVSVLRALPTIWHGLREGLRDFRGARGQRASMARTDRDLSTKFILIGILGLLAAITIARPLSMNLLGAILIVLFGFIFVTVSSRLTGEIGSSSNPISGMTVATLLLTCLIFLALDWTEARYYVTALSVGGIVCIASSNGGTTSQSIKTGFLVGATPRYQQIALLVGALASALILGPVLLRLNQTATVYVPVASLQNIPETMRIDPGKLAKREKLVGPQAVTDRREYFVWHNMDETIGPPGRYLVDDTGRPVYLVDPGINGTYRTRPDGTAVEKFDAPKATLMSYIIKGILSRKLPWGLVLIGAMIAVVLEMSFLPSLAFATGVYLPLSSSTPIFVGGFVRWMVDKYLRQKYAGHNLTEEQLAAEGDKSPGVLLASGYIAGGAIAGILIAFMLGLADPNATDFRRALAGFTEKMVELSHRNPLAEGAWSDVLSLVPFLVLAALLYLTGRDIILAGKKAH
ncbi:MAG: oligopeptide transporter, OPT family [Verrucomicrobia bacterium]|nr:oligopeptide transporter, OPT family [Verrucomicrobiota bacterium]